MECHRTTYQLVVIVFYGVDPSELRNLRGMIAEAFNDLLSGIKVEEDSTSRNWFHKRASHSNKFQKIVEDVTAMLDRIDLFIAEHPVVVESRVEDVIQVLYNHEAKDILSLGIWGMGGMSNTTIAKAIYNKIGHKFQGRSFLLNIREEWKKTNGPVSLRNKLLTHIFNTTKIRIHNIEEGKLKLKERLCQKPILLVLDDVDKPEQLKALCGSYEWFRAGSRIIITTRDKKLARIRIKKEDLARVGSEIYTLKQMDEKDSIELFSWHAFNEASPSEEFHELSGKIVSYCGGCHWLLKSWGMDRKDVIQILDGCGLLAETGLNVLVERSLVVVDNNNRLGMHDLLRDMGREIIREKMPKDPGMHSRLWNPEDAFQFPMGYPNIEGLALKLSRTEKVETKAFEKIIKLRLLQLTGVEPVGNFNMLQEISDGYLGRNFLSATPLKSVIKEI
ncbi:hypothetical protein PIB30_081601 [Stylosanthes scabra]|uniref:Uncharacterized protein n=1 Tax=Stylosanthes scabra TaxID=79078 RepID=A0ABU6VQ94_9FABA|nr:hypothetical protein [Stylosanthes scabra]